MNNDDKKDVTGADGATTDTTAAAVAVIDLDKERVAYRAEGNANLVISLCDRGMVLRMRKSIKTNAVATPEEDVVALRRNIAYHEAISSLLGAEFSAKSSIVRVQSANWLNFNRKLEYERPEHRLDKQVCCTSAELYSDAAYLTDALNTKEWLPLATATALARTQLPLVEPLLTFAIEIKPKQGWWTKATDVVNGDAAVVSGACIDDAAAVADVVMDKCRYCCMQYLKMEQGKIQKRSSYCPLDLFSGCLPRMTSALNALLENPQNNMRIFREGQSLYCGGNRQWFDDDLLSIHLNTLFDDRCGCVEGAASCDNRNRSKFIAIIARALLAEFRDNCPEWVSMEQQFLDQTATKSSERVQLPERCVLNRVLNVQNMLAASLRFVPITTTTKPDATTDTSDIDKNRRIDAIVEKIGKQMQNDLSVDERYVLGASALDCSIMITFCRLPYGTDVDRLTAEQRRHVIWLERCDFETMHEADVKNMVKDDHDDAFMVKVTVIDLDAKHLREHRNRYEQQLQQSQEAYRRWFRQTDES